MKPGIAGRCARAVVVTGIALLLTVGAAVPAAGRPAPSPTVDIQSAAGLAPDGRSLTVQVLASCPERWSVVEAVVGISQGQVSGQAPFPLTCIGSPRMFTVTVSASGGSFQLGAAQASASVLIQRGNTQRAQDSESLDAQPTVLAELADTAQLESGGGAVTIAVTVACPVGVTALTSSVSVSQQGLTSGGGSYLPVCDGSRHTFTVRVVAFQGVYRVGTAQALTFAVVELGGVGFYGVDDGSIQIVT
jgi:hypothetical protein